MDTKVQKNTFNKFQHRLEPILLIKVSIARFIVPSAGKFRDDMIF
jgi:hypothetical protein